MASRLLLTALGVFWLVMTLLIWRSEYRGTQLAGTRIDPETVWQRILTSPDSSSMAILLEGNRIGFCHLITSVADNLNQMARTNAPEGMIHEISNYQLDISGSVNDEGEGMRVRFDGEILLSQDQQMESFKVQIIARPLFLTAGSTTHPRVLRLLVEGPGYSSDRLVRIDDLTRPEAVLADLFGPLAPIALGALPFGVPEADLFNVQPQTQWKAFTDRITLGNAMSQVYRLEWNPMEGVQVSLLVSRAGELLRVELPQGLTLVNEALTDL